MGGPLERPLTNTELSSFRRCRRQWWLAWYRRLKPANRDPNSPLVVGGNVHEVLQEWYRSEGSLHSILERVCPGNDMVAAITEGYLQWLADTGADQGLEVLSVEVVHETLLPVIGRRIRSKADVRFRDAEGRVVVMDHKTGELKVPTASIDTQPLHYMLVERLKGAGSAPWALEFWHNRMRRVKRTVRARPPFFGRVQVYHTDSDLDSYLHRVIQQVGDMAALVAKLDAGADPVTAAYPTPTRSCSYDCDFFGVCPMFDSSQADAEVVVALAYKEGDPLAHHGNAPVA